MAEIRVPTLGESITEATIGRWFKKAGEAVAVDEPLVELETDKVTIEVPAPAAGVLSEIAVKDGETVAVGALLGQIKEGAGAPSAKPPAAPTVVTMVRVRIRYLLVDQNNVWTNCLRDIPPGWPPSCRHSG
jgi:pyruvate/2-oxoglutarate dehydrogenase complex dihydrolipoamide acyltransferase (E2) component